MSDGLSFSLSTSTPQSDGGGDVQHERIIIIGSGPAGLTATMYAIQKRLDVLLITRDLGGKTGPDDTLICLSCHKMHHGRDGRYMLADTLNRYLYKADPPKIAFARATGLITIDALKKAVEQKFGSKGKELVEKMAIKRDKLELSEKAKELHKERDQKFLALDENLLKI